MDRSLNFGFMDGSRYDVQGTQVAPPLPQTSIANPTKTLPIMSAPSGDPITKFNVALLDMLKRAQGQDNTALYKQKGQLEQTQVARISAPTPEAQRILSPGQQNAIRSGSADALNPDIQNTTDRIKLANEAVARFGDTLKAAKDYGEEFAKYVPVDEQTTEAVRIQLRAGSLPDKDVLAKVAKSLTADDWNAWAEANGKNKPIEVSGGNSLFDPKTGKAIYTAPKSYAPTSPRGSSGSQPATPEKPPIKFTDTQTAKGAQASGLPIDQFKKLDPDAQNEYINGKFKNLVGGRVVKKDLENMKKEIDKALDNKEGVGGLRAEIDDSDIPQADKEELKQYVETQAKARQSWFSKLNPFD